MTALDDAVAGWEAAAVALGDRACHGSAHASPVHFERSGRTDAERLAYLAPPREFPAVVDFGCGTGRVARHLVEMYPRVVLVDGSQTMLDTAMRYADHRRDRTGTARPFGWALWPVQYGGLRWLLDAAPVDVVAAFNVFLHIPKESLPGIVAEIGRWLRPGGRLVFNLPFVTREHAGVETLPDAAALPGGLNFWSVDEFSRAVLPEVDGLWSSGLLTPPVARREWNVEHGALSWLQKGMTV